MRALRILARCAPALVSLLLPFVAISYFDVGRAQEKTFRLRGEIVDADSGVRLPARVYLQAADGPWHFPASDGGSAVTYKKQRPGTRSRCTRR